MKLSPNVKTWLIRIIKLAIFAVVLVGIVHTVRKSLDEFAAHQFSLFDVDATWLVLAGVFYLLGSAPSWLFWHQALRAMGQRPALWESLRAFYIGHLGKYVPGKAMVVVLRADFVRSQRVEATVAATAVFVETLTTMAVGALMSAAILGVFFREQTSLLLLAIFLMACAGIPTLPPIFRRIVRLLQVKRANANIEQALAGLDFRLMGTGWVLIAVGWCLLGLSLWATVKAMPDGGRQLAEPLAIPLLTACVALAMVAGFLSLLPGGIGVRELVVMTLLAPQFGEVTAIVSAVLLRLVWLVSELVFSGILYVAVRRPQQDQPPVRASSAGARSQPAKLHK